MRKTARGKTLSAATNLWSPRTFAIVGHRSCGKTSLGELLLQATRVIRSAGSVDQGTTLLDWSEESQRHRMSCALSTAWFDHADESFVIIDTPGASGLAHEQAMALHVADAALLVVDARQGVEVGTERAMARLKERPWWGVVSKLDQLQLGLDELVQRIEQAADRRVVPLHLPLWDEDDSLQGIVDVLGGQVLRYATDGTGALSPEPIPRRLHEAVALAYERIAESVAMTDDELLEQYLEDLELPEATLREGLGRAIAERKIAPLLLTSATHHIGAAPLLDAMARWAPPSCPAPWVGDPLAPEHFAAQVVAVQRGAEGQPIHWLKVWSGHPPRKGWRVAKDGER